MQAGGGDYNQEATRAVRVMSILITPVLALYSILVVSGLVPSTHYLGDPVAVGGMAILWVVLSFYYYIKEATHRVDQAFRIVVHHIFALALFSLVVGFWQPFVALFVLLFMASNLYFGRKGLSYSITAFMLVGAIDIIARFPNQPSIIYETGLPVLSVIFLGTAIIGIMSAQETKRQTLLHSQKRERLQYDRVLTIMNNLSDAAFSTDEHGKILMYNAASLSLLDTNDSLRGRLLGDVLRLTTSDGDPIDIYKTLKDAQKVTRRDDFNHTYSDGESVRLEITFAPIRSSYTTRKHGEEQHGYILIMRDVTKQKSLEEERDEFISVVSHELRTPITIVEGTLSNLEVLMNRAQTPDPKVLSRSVTTAHDQVLYLAKMVNDLSTLSRAERGVADETEQIDVTILLKNLHDRYQKEATNQKLHLNLDIGPQLGTVTVSRLYLEELLQNFVTNAIKYTHEGSVTIIAKRTKNTVMLGVKDTGIGISRTDQAKVFHKFYRSEDYRIRETNGTGLGLYVSTKLAHKLGTTIILKSRLNHGSTFCFELPTE